MRIFFHSLLCTIVITLLNGCFFFQDDDQRWEIEPNGATSFALSRDGRFALLYSQQKQLLLWDLVQDKELAQLGPQDQSKIKYPVFASLTMVALPLPPVR